MPRSDTIPWEDPDEQTANWAPGSAPAAQVYVVGTAESTGEPPPLPHAGAVPSMAPAPLFTPQTISWQEDQDDPFAPRASVWPARILVSAAALAVGSVVMALVGHFTELAERQSRIEQLLPQMQQADEARGRERDVAAASPQPSEIGARTLRPLAEAPASTRVAAPLMPGPQRRHGKPARPLLEFTTVDSPPRLESSGRREPLGAKPAETEPANVTPTITAPATAAPAAARPASTESGFNQSEDPLFGL